MASLDDLSAKASDLAANSTRIEDLEKATSIAKMVAEIKQQHADEVSQKLTLKYERWKSLATLLVPLLTVMTLFVTVYIQYLQITVTREANEDTQWREAMKTLAATQGQNFLSDVAATSMLKPFFLSARYANQAYDTSFVLFGRMGSLEALRDLYNSAFGTPVWSNQAGVTRVARIANGQLGRLNEVLSTLQSNPQRLAQTKKTPQMPGGIGSLGLVTQYDQLAHARQEVVNEVGFLTGEVIAILRIPRPADQASDLVDLTDILLLDADASGVDFSVAKFKNTGFERVDVRGASITPSGAENSTSYWSGTQWWKAARIDRSILKSLIEQNYPYNDPEEQFDGVVSSRDEYVSDVLALCKQVDLECKASDLKYGEPAPPEVPAAQDTSKPDTGK